MDEEEERWDTSVIYMVDIVKMVFNSIAMIKNIESSSILVLV
jgi:hypothetical protein